MCWPEEKLKIAKGITATTAATTSSECWAKIRMRLQKVLSPLLVRIPNYAGAFGSSGFSASSQNWRTQHVAYVRVRWCLCHFMLCAIFGADVLFSSAFFCFATQCICLRFFGSHHRLHLAPYYKQVAVRKRENTGKETTKQNTRAVQQEC